MLNTIIHRFTNIAHSSWFWILTIIAGLALLVVALFYQYIFDELPCVLCIQIRLWISLLVVISIIAVFIHRYRLPNFIAHLCVFATAIALTERSYQLLGTERGFCLVIADLLLDYRHGLRLKNGYHGFTVLRRRGAIRLKLFSVSPWQKH
jgi:disulfide bond formation protein DsbB